jgi:hypothetical protein
VPTLFAFDLFTSKEPTNGLIALGLAALGVVVALRLYHGFRMRRLQSELSRLRVIVGEFTESDIENVLRAAVSLEVQGDRDGAWALFRLVAEKSTDPRSVKLASSSMDRLSNQRRR